MNPRLLLLTGPAAGEVASVLELETNPYPAVGTFGLSPEEIAQILRRQPPGTAPLGNNWVNADTWPEAVRAALGES